MAFADDYDVAISYAASAKPLEMIGKGGAGDLPCLGARGVPLSFPLSQRGGVVIQ